MSDGTVKQRANVYTVMMVVAFLCLVAANLFLYFEMSRFDFVLKLPDALKKSNAEKFAQESVPAAAVEGEPMPMGEPMADPAAPMADPAAPMADPAMPADPAAPAADPAAAPAADPAAAAMPAEPGM